MAVEVVNLFPSGSTTGGRLRCLAVFFFHFAHGNSGIEYVGTNNAVLWCARGLCPPPEPSRVASICSQPVVWWNTRQRQISIM